MDTFVLPEVSATLLDEARAHPANRAALTVCGGTGHTLRQTVIALLAGSTLSEHENPGEATLQVLVGRVQLSWSDGAVDLAAGEHVVIPQEKHALLAHTDAVVLLTAANL